MLSFEIGDRIRHSQNGEGTILRIGVGPKGSLLDVMFDENAGVGRFVESVSKNIEAVNGVAVNRRLLKWKPTNYSVLAARDFSEEQMSFFQQFVSRITYRPHPYSFEKFISDYESVTGAECPMDSTNRHESAYSDCAEVYFSSHPPVGLFEFKLKQDGDQWFTENVGLAWALFRAGFRVSVPKD